jgi:DNA-binding NtrC family response regulator
VSTQDPKRGIKQQMVKKSGSVIVFDQDPELLKVLSGSLNLFGYRVVSSARLRDTLQKIDRQKFVGIVLSIDSADSLDQVLGSLNQKDSLNKNTPLIVVTPSLEMKLEKTLAGPIKKILSKPFSIHDFCSAVCSTN